MSSKLHECTMSNLSFRNRSDIVQSARKHIQQRENVLQIKKSFLWGGINCFLLSLLLYELLFGNVVFNGPIHSFQVIIIIILCVNICFHSSRVVWIYIKARTEPKTAEKDLKTSSKLEQKCLNFDNWDYQPPPGDLFSCFQRSDWVVVSGEKSEQKSEQSFSGENNTSYSIHQRTPSDKVNDVSITSFGQFQDRRSFQRSFTADLSDTRHELSFQEGQNGKPKFWSDTTTSNDEVSPIFYRIIYQTSPMPCDTVSMEDGSGSIISTYAWTTDLWEKHKINPNNLVNWISNLRMWISCTILQRIVDEIESINSTLKSLGFSGLMVGKVDLEILTHTAMTNTTLVPTLSFLIPFLNLSVMSLSSNQQYIVQRIRELAEGSCMSDFKWKSGGKFNSKPWDSSLPTDAELVMHLVSTYLDSQLPHLPSEPESRPFTSQYFSKYPNKPKQTELAIHQIKASFPHFQMYMKDEIYDIPQGRNNLFFTLLMFLYHIQNDHRGMLGRISLGPSGINMLWIIQT